MGMPDITPRDGDKSKWNKPKTIREWLRRRLRRFVCPDCGGRRVFLWATMFATITTCENCGNVWRESDT